MMKQKNKKLDELGTNQLLTMAEAGNTRALAALRRRAKNRPNSIFAALVHALEMTEARLLAFALADNELSREIQRRVEELRKELEAASFPILILLFAERVLLAWVNRAHLRYLCEISVDATPADRDRYQRQFENTDREYQRLQTYFTKLRENSRPVGGKRAKVAEPSEPAVIGLSGPTTEEPPAPP